MHKITATYGVKDAVLWGIFVTALEGGIGYWSEAISYNFSVPGSAGNEEDHLGFSAQIIEIDDPDQKTHRIDRKVILRGLTKALSADPGVADHIVSDARREVVLGDGGYLDAEGADAIVQLGLFNELVYG